MQDSENTRLKPFRQLGGTSRKLRHRTFNGEKLDTLFELIGNSALLKKVNIAELVDEECGEYTLMT